LELYVVLAGPHAGFSKGEIEAVGDPSSRSLGEKLLDAEKVLILDILSITSNCRNFIPHTPTSKL